MQGPVTFVKPLSVTWQAVLQRACLQKLSPIDTPRACAPQGVGMRWSRRSGIPGTRRSTELVLTPHAGRNVYSRALQRIPGFQYRDEVPRSKAVLLDSSVID